MGIWFLGRSKRSILGEKAMNLKLLVGMGLIVIVHRGIVLPHVVNGWLIEGSRWWLD